MAAITCNPEVAAYILMLICYLQVNSALCIYLMVLLFM